MNIYPRNFRIASNVSWDGKELSNKQSIKASCLRNIGPFKLFVFKEWGGNGFGNNADYYVVNIETSTIYNFYSVDQRKVVSRIVEFLKSEPEL